MPTTRAFGKPVSRFISVTMASSGLETTITKRVRRMLLDVLRDGLTIFALMPIRSSRLMPGLRATPAVTMQTSAPRSSA